MYNYKAKTKGWYQYGCSRVACTPFDIGACINVYMYNIYICTNAYTSVRSRNRVSQAASHFFPKRTLGSTWNGSRCWTEKAK